jgi:hypothetical protein
MRSLRALLAQWQPAGERLPPGGEASALGAAWPEAVGEDVARRTRASTYRDGTLTVVTPSSAWSHQLTFLAPTIVQRLRERCPQIDVRKLKFVVATGRSRALLAGAKQRDAHGGRMNPTAPGGAKRERTSAATAEASDDPALWLARLRREQAGLDGERHAQGWQRCASCGRWSRARRCQPCAQDQQRRADGRVAALIASAPWLRFEQHAAGAAWLDARTYARVRRSLLAQWERQLQDAQQRLRRDALEAADRIVAWSYVMLALHARQDDVSPAVLASTLGHRWANALLDAAAPHVSARERKAQRQAREK